MIGAPTRNTETELETNTDESETVDENTFDGQLRAMLLLFGFTCLLLNLGMGVVEQSLVSVGSVYVALCANALYEFLDR